MTCEEELEAAAWAAVRKKKPVVWVAAWVVVWAAAMDASKELLKRETEKKNSEVEEGRYHPRSLVVTDQHVYLATVRLGVRVL